MSFFNEYKAFNDIDIICIMVSRRKSFNHTSGLVYGTIEVTSIGLYKPVYPFSSWRK